MLRYIYIHQIGGGWGGDIYLATKWKLQGKYPLLATDTELKSCFSIYNKQ